MCRSSCFFKKELAAAAMAMVPVPAPARRTSVTAPSMTIVSQNVNVSPNVTAMRALGSSHLQACARETVLVRAHCAIALLQRLARWRTQCTTH